MRFQDKFYPITLQYSLHEFILSGFMCDVTLVVEGHEFKAHKLVLSAASPFFRVMFNADSSFIESVQEKINLYGVDREALEEILKFIYTSNIEINETNVYLLMEAANLFQIHALRSYISYYLQNSLSVDNCMQLYVMANLYQYNDLSNTAFHFLLVNFSKVVEKNEFLELPLDVIIKIVSSKLLDTSGEENVCENILRWVRADAESRKQHIELLISKIDLHLLPAEYLAKIKSDPLITEKLKAKIEESTNYSPHNSSISHIFPKEIQPYLLKSRHKAEGAVIFAIGGESSGMASQSVECYTLGYDKWRYIVPECIIKRHETKHTNVLPPLRCARYHAAFANDAYNVYVIGGRNSTSLLDECEVFNVKTNQWKYFKKFPNKLFGSAAAFLDGVLFVVGGLGEQGILDSVWKLDKVRKSWISMPPINSPRSFHATVSIGGYIFVLGGFDQEMQGAIRSCERFDYTSNRWFEISPMQQPRAKFGCAAMDNYIYVFGGTSGISDCMKSVERYNIFTNEWSYVTSMVMPRHSFSVAVSDHEVYCLGGSDGTHFLDTVEKFSLKTKRWHCMHSMQISRLAPAAAALLVPYTSRE